MQLTKLKLLARIRRKIYQAVSKFDSAGYYYEAGSQCHDQANRTYQKAGDQYFEAFSFAATEERANVLR